MTYPNRAAFSGSQTSIEKEAFVAGPELGSGTIKIYPQTAL